MGAVAVAVALAVVLAGCSGGGTSTTGPTVPTAPPTSSTTAAPDISVVPQAIDEAYLNAVLAALDQVAGDGSRLVVARKQFDADAADILNAIYSDERLGIESELWFRTLAEDPELTAIKPDPGNRTSTVERIITARPDCVWMAVRRDYSANATQEAPPSTEYVALRPLDRSNDPRRLNPTAWMITVEGFNSQGMEPSNQCDAQP